MKVLIDMDGPLYQWQRTYRYMLREHRGVQMPPVDEAWTHWDAQEAYGEKEDHDWMWSEGVERGLFRYGHMTTGARIGLEELVEDGHKLYIVTSRPENAVNDTMDWLSLYLKGIPLSGIHILSDGKPKSVVDGHVLIDDKMSNCEEFAGSHKNRHAILFERAWSGGRDVHRVLRTEAWWDTVDAVRYLEGRYGC